MGKLFWQISTSLDGFMEDQDRSLKRTAGVNDPEFERYALEMLQSIDAFVIGRKTYELFVDYWPKATGPDANLLNALPKLVASRTLASADWNNAKVVGDGLIDEVKALKKSSERDVAVFGSSSLAASLHKAGVIEEYRIFVTPFIIGGGKKTFDLTKGRELELLRSEQWPSGTVALTYGLRS